MDRRKRQRLCQGLSLVAMYAHADAETMMDEDDPERREQAAKMVEACGWIWQQVRLMKPAAARVCRSGHPALTR